MSVVSQCTCTDLFGFTTPHGFEFLAVRKNPSCPVHGRPLSKRGKDDWTPFLGVTSPNQTESSEKVGVTPIH